MHPFNRVNDLNIKIAHLNISQLRFSGTLAVIRFNYYVPGSRPKFGQYRQIEGCERLGLVGQRWKRNPDLE